MNRNLVTDVLQCDWLLLCRQFAVIG